MHRVLRLMVVLRNYISLSSSKIQGVMNTDIWGTQFTQRGWIDFSMNTSCCLLGHYILRLHYPRSSRLIIIQMISVRFLSTLSELLIVSFSIIDILKFPSRGKRALRRPHNLWVWSFQWLNILCLYGRVWWHQLLACFRLSTV